jgi:hypothetical protein
LRVLVCQNDLLTFVDLGITKKYRENIIFQRIFVEVAWRILGSRVQRDFLLALNVQEFSAHWGGLIGDSTITKKKSEGTLSNIPKTHKTLKSRANLTPSLDYMIPAGSYR